MVCPDSALPRQQKKPQRSYPLRLQCVCMYSVFNGRNTSEHTKCNTEKCLCQCQKSVKKCHYYINAVHLHYCYRNVITISLIYSTVLTSLYITNLFFKKLIKIILINHQASPITLFFPIEYKSTFIKLSDSKFFITYIILKYINLNVYTCIKYNSFHHYRFFLFDYQPHHIHNL